MLDKSSRKVVAAAITTPPRCVPFNKSGDEMGTHLRTAGMSMGPDILLNPRMKTLGIWMGNMEEGQASVLNGNFLYVSIFATAPEYQGHGCGSALLGFLGMLADTDGVVSYLETAGVRNTNFYAKKGGYNVVGKSHIATF